MGNFVDLTGMRFGKLTVLSRNADYIQPSGQHKRMWHCRCDCGNECNVRANDLQSGNTTSCGCVQKESRGKSQFQDLTGQRFGRLVVLERLPNHVTPSGQQQRMWKCVCDCGKTIDVYATQLKRGMVSCGCIKKEEREQKNQDATPAKKVLKGFNDLQTKYPHIAELWHPTKNLPLSPDSVLSGSGKKVWWLGKCGHAFDQAIINMVNGAGCPYCSHQKLLQGFNDFATTNPDLLSEWDYENNAVQPSEIMANSHYKAYWKCPFGHTYKAWMTNRCGKSHTGCSVCDKENHTSFPEQALFYYVKQAFYDARNSDREATGIELDIYIPSLMTAIEYDGYNWHKSNTYEIKKNAKCLERGIRLIRIREKGLQPLSDCECIYREDNRSSESLNITIVNALSLLGCTSIDVDVERDSAIIYSSYVITRKQQSLLAKAPLVAQEWHPTKNGELTPEMFYPLTDKKVWWLGKCGHEWYMSIQDRVAQRCNCPICSGKRIVSGINDLLSNYPDLCLEWDYEQNDKQKLFPDRIAPHSDRKAWWKCRKCGHTWYAKIDGRTRMKAGCPQCGKEKISQAKYKPVMCIDTGIVYGSLQEAEAKTGISRSCIGNCCRGTQKRAGGFHWQFIEKSIENS